VNLSADESKAALRHRVLTARASVGDLAAASAAVCRRLDHLPELAAARCVVGYAAFGSEVSVDPSLRRLLQAGVTVCLPWVEGDDLGISAVADLADLAPGWRGVREPPPATRRPLRPVRVDAFVVPGVAFDPSGNRLGYGGGHFDRLLARARRGAVVIGVALDEQVVARVPREPHDRPVDVVVTPTTTHRPPTQD